MNGKETLRSEGKALSCSNSIDYVVAQWPGLPPHIREAIVTLVDAAIATTFSNKQIHSLEDNEG